MRQAGDLSSSLILMNYTFGNGFLYAGCRLNKIFSALLHGVFGYSGSNFSNSFLYLGFIALISYPSYFILPSPLKG